jgi:hypothetical protein
MACGAPRSRPSRRPAVATRSTHGMRPSCPATSGATGAAGVRRRDRAELMDTARAAANGVTIVTAHQFGSGPCSTPSHRTTLAAIARGYQDSPSAGAHHRCLRPFGRQVALESPPDEIAYDFATTRKIPRRHRATGRFPASTSTRAHFDHRSSNPAAFIEEFAEPKSYTPTSRTTSASDGPHSSIAPRLRRPAARLGLRLPRPRRRRLEVLIRALNRIGYDGRSRSSGRTRDGSQWARAMPSPSSAHRFEPSTSGSCGLRRGGCMVKREIVNCLMRD